MSNQPGTANGGPGGGEDIELSELKKPSLFPEGEPEPDSESELLEKATDSDGEAKRDWTGYIRIHGASLGEELTLINGIAFVVGQIIGSGIWITPGTVLKYTGSFGLSLIIWVVGGFIALFGALSYIELGTLVKKSGAEYAYILEAYSFKRRKPWTEFTGSLLAFLFTWSSTFIIRAAGIAVVTQAFGTYLAYPFYIGCVDDPPGYVVNLLALCAIITLTMINCYSVRLSARVMTVLSFIKLLTCGFVIILGISQVIQRHAFTDDAQRPFRGSTNSPFKVSVAFYAVLWAYDGWNILNYAVEEAKNVEKNLPRALIIGVPIVVTCYIAINVAFFLVLTYDEILGADAVALTFAEEILGAAGLVILPLLVALSTFGAANGILFAGARLVFASSRDGFLPELFSGVHKTFKTPMPAVLSQAFIASVLVLAGNLEGLVDAFNAASWVFYGLAFGGLIIMRVTHKDSPRPYKVWIVIPIFMVLTSIFLVTVPVFQKPVPTLAAFGMILLGVPIYIFLVMETPWRYRPPVLDRFSEFLTTLTEALLNTESSR